MSNNWHAQSCCHNVILGWLQMHLICCLCINSAPLRHNTFFPPPSECDGADKIRSPKKPQTFSILWIWLTLHESPATLFFFFFFVTSNFKSHSACCERNCLSGNEDTVSHRWPPTVSSNPKAMMRCSIADTAGAPGQYPACTVVFIRTLLWISPSILHRLELMNNFLTEMLTITFCLPESSSVSQMCLISALICPHLSEFFWSSRIIV